MADGVRKYLPVLLCALFFILSFDESMTWCFGAAQIYNDIYIEYITLCSSPSTIFYPPPPCLYKQSRLLESEPVTTP